jgi:hypothetical protein
MALEAAITEDNSEAFLRSLHAMRQQTAAIAKTKPGQHVRTAEEQQSAFEAHFAKQNRTTLEHEGRKIDPASLLRDLRLKSSNYLKVFQKQGRLSRWRAGSAIAAEASTPVASDEATIQTGEVWLVLWGSTKVVPSVVYGAFAPWKNGLRPESNSQQPLLLKDVTSIQLQLFGNGLLQANNAGIFQATGFDLTRTPRQMLLRLACSRGPFMDVDVSLIRSQRLLTLCEPAM